MKFPKMIPRLRRSIPRIALAAYLLGLWWWLLRDWWSGYGIGAPEIFVGLIISPVVLLVAPWSLLIRDERILPLLLTYGALALWLFARQLIAALERRHQ